MKNAVALVVVAGVAAAASAQDFSIDMVAPATVAQGGTYTVEVWGSVSGGSFVDGVSAMAGFGIDALATGGAGLVAGTSAGVVSGWAAGFGNEGVVNGADINGVSGGQIANIFNLNPGIDLSNPILLFTFDVTAGNEVGDITYTPGNPNVNGALSYYPSSTDGASVIAPNDDGTTITYNGATTSVVPAPASLALLGLGGLVARRRR